MRGMRGWGRLRERFSKEGDEEARKWYVLRVDLLTAPNLPHPLIQIKEEAAIPC
jgi:hypothetical protein